MRNLKWTKNMLELFFGPFLNFLIRPKLFHVAPPYDSFIENAHEKSSLNLQLSTPMQGFSSTPYRGVWDVNSAFIMLGASCCQGAVCPLLQYFYWKSAAKIYKISETNKYFTSFFRKKRKKVWELIMTIFLVYFLYIILSYFLWRYFGV